MANLNYVTATDLANGLLPLYTRGDTLSQTMEDKPLLKFFEDNKKSFPGGNGYVSDPVQGAYMSDSSTLAGYSQDDQLQFGQATNIQRTNFPWKEHNYGLIISWSELKADGITISDSQKVTQHSEKELFVLTDILKNRMSDFMESYTRGKARLFFLDGSQDSKAMPGLKSILTDTPATGTTGGINRATYSWWQHRANLSLSASPANQTLCRFLQSELRQLKKYGGKPDFAVCGSDFLNALETEVYAKGVLTQEGFANKGKTKFGMSEISLLGLGTFVWDPMLDDLGESKRCYIIDSRRIKVRPMEDEDDKALTPERPYNYAVFLYNMTWTGVETATQLNSNGVYAIA
ncbi:MAG: phage major capsid protein [Betaproteobacteria bacterium]